MAKTKERKALKKGKASFNLIGEVKLTDKTFSLNNEYNSGWTDNSMYVGIDCGIGNIVYAEMRGGFFPDQDNVIRAFSKTDKDDNGKSTQLEIDWEDRFDGDIIDEVAKTSLITIGIESDVKGRTVTKDFLSAYDAVEYLAEYLENGMVVNVKGNLRYSEYDGNVSVKKEITSIFASKMEEENYRATFTQQILVDNKGIGKLDKEKNTVSLNAYVVDYVGKPKIDGEKYDVCQNVVFPRSFEFEMNSEHPELTGKILSKFFKPTKKDNLMTVTAVGNLIEGANIVEIQDEDINEEIALLFEANIWDKESVENKGKAVGQGTREKRMVITKPDIIFVGDEGDKKPHVAYEDGEYTINDLYFYEQALIDAGYDPDEDGNGNDSENSQSESNMSDEDILADILGV